MRERCTTCARRWCRWCSGPPSCIAVPVDPGRMPTASLASVPRQRWQGSRDRVGVDAECSQSGRPLTPCRFRRSCHRGLTEPDLDVVDDGLRIGCCVCGCGGYAPSDNYSKPSLSYKRRVSIGEAASGPALYRHPPARRAFFPIPSRLRRPADGPRQYFRRTPVRSIASASHHR